MVTHVNSLEDPSGEETQAVTDDHGASKAEDKVYQGNKKFLGSDTSADKLASGSEESDGNGIIHYLRRRRRSG